MTAAVSESVLGVLWRMSQALTCPLCSRLLSRPSTLPCAHHVCRDCLLDYSTTSGAAASAATGGTGECVCPVLGCRRPYWSREWQSDNKQLHSIAASFALMRDDILAAAAAAGSSSGQYAEQQWPNQTEPTAEEAADSPRHDKRRAAQRGFTRGRKTVQSSAEAESEVATRSAASPKPVSGRRAVLRQAEADSARRSAHRAHTEQLEQAESGSEEEAEQEEEDGVPESDELVGDREARRRMRARARRATEQPATPLHGHSSGERPAEGKATEHSSSSSAADSGVQLPSQHTRPSEADILSCSNTQARGGVAAVTGTAVPSSASAPVSPSSSSSSSSSSSLSSSARPAADQTALPGATVSTPPTRSLVLSSASRSHLRSAQQCVERLGSATLVPPAGSGWSHSVSHVLCCNSSEGQRLVKRTMKYMLGVLHGCWVLDVQWLTDSAAAGEWLSEAEYEIRGDTIAGATRAAQRAREERQRVNTATPQPLRTKAQHQPPSSLPRPPPASHCGLLAGCWVSVLQPVSAHCPSLPDLTLLIEAAGGRLLLPLLNITNAHSSDAAAGERSVADWVGAVQSQLPTPPASSPATPSAVVLCRPSLLEAVESGECLPLSALRPLARLCGGVQLLSISWLLDSIGAFARLPVDDSVLGSRGTPTGGSMHMYSLTHLIPRGNPDAP